MAEGATDDEDKTEEPSHKKLREARERGQVAQSREVNTWIMLFTAALLMTTTGAWFCESIVTIVRGFISQPHAFQMDGPALVETMKTLCFSVFKVLAIPLVLFLIAGFLSGFLQVGPLLSTENLQPKLEKIDPMKGAKRVFGSRAWIEFAKAILKMTIVSAATVTVLWPIIHDSPGMVGLDPGVMMEELKFEIKQLFIAVLSVLFVFAAIDFGIQRFQLMKQLRMSRQELRDEYKQTEGDPHIKARLRELRLQRARKRMMAQVPKADVVITNPTHFAIALQYEQGKSAAPMVVAKGQDRIALKIREIATENSVPIVENPPLARALYDTVDLDQEIPEEHYKAVAEIISYIFSLKRR